MHKHNVLFTDTVPMTNFKVEYAPPSSMSKCNGCDQNIVKVAYYTKNKMFLLQLIVVLCFCCTYFY
jgi:hypothetical protein